MLRAILFSLALLSGGIAAWLVESQRPSELWAAPDTLPEPVPTTDVLVAAAAVEQGGKLLPEDMRWQAWPEEVVQDVFILRSRRPDAVDELAGSIVRAPLVMGAPVIPENVAPSETSYLSAVLNEGMRAVAISVSAEKTAGGFVLPNDRVDVLLAAPCRPQDGCHEGTNVRTILKNVRILAIDQSGSETDSDGVLVGKTATLELTPDQAETIIGAEASGTLSLVLRAAADRGNEIETPQDSRRTVRVLRGGVGEYVTVR